MAAAKPKPPTTLYIRIDTTSQTHQATLAGTKAPIPVGGSIAFHPSGQGAIELTELLVSPDTIKALCRKNGYAAPR